MVFKRNPGKENTKNKKKTIATCLKLSAIFTLKCKVNVGLLFFFFFNFVDKNETRRDINYLLRVSRFFFSHPSLEENLNGKF